MKKVFSVISLITCFAACKEPSTPPQAVLDSMFTAMKHGNLDDMKKYVTKSDMAMLDAAEKFMTSIDSAGVQQIKTRITDELKERSKNIRYHFKNEKIEDDHATVEVEIVDNDPDLPRDKKTSSHHFELVKEDNAWKIALSKPGNEMFNSMKGNMGPGNRDLKGGIEKLKHMDPDSLKMLIGKGLQALDSLDKRKKANSPSN